VKHLAASNYRWGHHYWLFFLHIFQAHNCRSVKFVHLDPVQIAALSHHVRTFRQNKASYSANVSMKNIGQILPWAVNLMSKPLTWCHIYNQENYALWDEIDKTPGRL